MEFTIKEKINNTIEQLENQHKKYNDEVNSITNMKIYTADEQNRRIKEIKTKYQDGAKTTAENLKKCVESWIDSDIKKMYSETDKEKNSANIAADFYLISAGNFSDKDKFEFLKKYFGDMETMKKFYGLPYMKNERTLTAHILSLAYNVENLSEEVVKNFNHYLDLNSRQYTPFNSGSKETLPCVIFEQTLTNSVDKLCSAFELIKKAKTAKYDEIKAEVK